METTAGLDEGFTTNPVFPHVSERTSSRVYIKHLNGCTDLWPAEGSNYTRTNYTTTNVMIAFDYLKTQVVLQG